MSMNHKISIITPVLNGERYIRTTIESVLNQEYPHFEHIIIDGLSSDNTVNILKTYDHLVWISEKDNGAVDAANKGLAMATGDIISFLPADDYYEPNVFKDIINTFNKYQGCKWVSGYCRIVGADGNEIRKYVTWYKNALLRHHSFELLLTECYISGMAVFFTKELLSEFGNLDLQLPSEYDLWLRFASKYEMRLIKKVIANFRMHEGATTSSFFITMERIALQAARKHGKRYPFLMFLRFLNTYKTIWAYSLLNRLL